MITEIQEAHVHAAVSTWSEPAARAATSTDVPAIVAIVNEYARQGHLLPRRADDIRASLPSWLVAEVDDRIVGVGSLVEMSRALVEVRSLVVLPEYRHYGVGRLIVDGLAEQARRRGFTTIFALTRAVPFF